MYGKLNVKITCADSPFLLNAINTAGILMQHISYQDDLTIIITVNYADFNALHNICDQQGASVKILAKSGLQFILMSIMKRPVILSFLFLITTLALFLPSRIFFVSVEGNKAVPTNEILEAAEKCGIVFGASRRQVRSEKMKNSLLQSLPELQWAGINTSGCKAIISVREKTTQETSDEEKHMVSSIVASRDGVIQNCTVYQGNVLCSVGQAVKKGQVLVSGYTDCGIVTKTSQAKAEIKALTFREIQAICPNATLVRGTQQKKITRYSVRIGKNLIKLYKDSGNFDTTCAKIYVERYVRLPGGFSLPFALIEETLCYYDTNAIQGSSDNGEWMTLFAEKYLHSTMIAGNIISKNTDISSIEHAIVLSGRYACMEIIGKVKYEQMMIEGE